MTFRRGGRRYALALAGVALLAAAVRLFAQAHATHLPFLGKYPQAARLLAAGDPALAGERLLDFSPLYLALAWGFEALGIASRSALGWLQAAAGVGAVLLAAHVGRRLGGPVAGIAAGLLLALDRMAVVAGTVLEPEIFFAVLLLAGTAWSLPPEEEAPNVVRPGRRQWQRALLAGSVFGVAVLVRPNALLVPLLLLALAPVAALVARRRPAGARVPALPRPGPALASAGLAGAVALLLLFLWLGVLHRIPTGQWAALMSPGQVLHQGNGPEATGFGLSYPTSVSFATARLADGSTPDFAHQSYRLVARAATGRCLTPVETEAYWRGRARAAVAERPNWALERLARRLGGSLSDRQVWDVVGAPEMEAILGAGVPVGLVLLLPLTLAAFLPLRRRRETRIPWVVLPGLAVALVTGAVFFVSGRHRLLLDVFLTVSAGVGAVALWRTFTQPAEARVRRWLVVVFLLVVGALPLLSPEPVILGRRILALDQRAGDLAWHARAAHQMGDTEAARRDGARAVVLDLGLAHDLPLSLARDPVFLAEARRLADQVVRGGDTPEASRAAVALVALGGCRELVTAVEERPVPLTGAASAGAQTQLALCHLRREAPAPVGRRALDALRHLDTPSVTVRAVLADADEAESIPDSHDPLSRTLARVRVLRDTRRQGDDLEDAVLKSLHRAARCTAP